MRSGQWGGRVSTDNVRVEVNGVERPVRDVRIQSGMRDGHPAANTSNMCITATIDWLSPHLVDAGAPQPFTGDSWAPATGDKVEIFTGDAATGQWWRQHIGQIDSSSGSMRDGTASSRTVDDVDELGKTFQNVALLYRMTPIRDGGPWRRQGLQSCWYVDRMMRDETAGAKGWHATPRQTWQTIGMVTALGSVRPEVGALQYAWNWISGVNYGPLWSWGSDGMPYPADAEYEATLSTDTRKGVITLGFPVTNKDAKGTLDLSDANGAGFTLGLNGSDNVVCSWTSGQVRYVPRRDATRAALAYERVSTSTVSMTLRLDDGREFTWDTTSASFPAAWRADRVHVRSNNAISWWMVEDEKPTGQRWAVLDDRPNSRIRITAMTYWQAARDVERTPVNSWVEEQLSAECAAAWLNEYGGFEWTGRGVLDAQPVATTFTSALAVDEVQWDVARRSAARNVIVKYQQPQISNNLAGDHVRELWSSDSIDLAPGEEEIVTVTVPSEEDWIAEDLTPTIVKSWGMSWDSYAVHSHFGGTQYRASSSDEAVWAQFVDCTFTKTGLRDYEIWYRPWPSMSGAFRLKSTYPPSTTAWSRDGRSPLVMRGRAVVTWVDREVSGPVGPDGPPTFLHDVGWRVQDYGGSLGRLLTWLQAELVNLKPVVSVTLAHDPRVQIGDKIRVEDPRKSGAWIEMLVQDRDFNGADFTDTITGRVTTYGRLTDVSLTTPHGPTPTTPTVSWNREDVA